MHSGPNPYFMKTARLGFRCWTAEDFPQARALWGDPDVTRFFGGPFSDQQVREKLHREIERMAVHQFQYWPIHQLCDDDHVGCCGLRVYRPELCMPELGFHLRPKYWGQGLAVEAARAAIAHAFNTLKAKGVSAGHHPHNGNSRKVLEKLGFQYTHDEFFAELGMNIPYYLLLPPP